MKLFNKVLTILLTCAAFSQISDAQEIKITRLNGKLPIISQETFTQQGYPAEDGGNINGPSLVRLPEWLAKKDRIDPKAQYYLYFAHHQGDYLRLAWAEKLTGPYHLVQDSGKFGPKEEAVFLLVDNINKVGPVSMKNHVASPVVIIDDENKQFKLYYHSPTIINGTGKNIGQKTYFATSSNGLSFKENVAQLYLGDFYFSPFEVEGRWHAFANHGLLYRAPAEGETFHKENFDAREALWEERDDFFKEVLEEYSAKNGFDPVLDVRHLAQTRVGDMLYIFFSCREDSPERMYYTKCDISDPDFRNWKPEEVKIAFSATETWEGSEATVIKSRGGYARGHLNEVRDPFIYKDKKGNLYLLYCAGGEQGIGIARLEINPGR